MIELLNKFVNKGQTTTTVKDLQADYSTPFHTHSSKRLFTVYKGKFTST